MTVPMVGRRLELARLRQCLEIARAGTPQVVFLEGEAGIGKSRLLRRVQQFATDVGVEVLPGRCIEHFDLPYLPFRNALLPRLAEVARTVPALAGSAEPIERALDAPADESSLLTEASFTTERARFLHAAALTTIAMSQERPVLVTVDDLQWADGPSIDLLVQLVLEASDAAIADAVPMLVVATHRHDLRHGLGRDLARLMREEICQRIEVGPLDELAVDQLIRELGLVRASRQLVEAVLRASGGNPLLLESAVPQLLRDGMREEGGELVPARSLEGLDLPEELASAVSARLQDLDEPARELLVVAAVVGHPFSIAEIANVAETPQSIVAKVLSTAMEHEIIIREHDNLTFAHPMFARVLRASTSSVRRQEIHVAAARAFAELATGEQDQILTVAWHLAEAGSAADAEVASATCRVAGERAWQLSAWAESANYFDAAVAAARRRNEPAGEVAELLTKAGSAHCRNIDPAPGRTRLHEAIELHKTNGNTAGAVRSLIEFVHAQVGWGSFGQPIELGPLEDLLPEIENEDVVLCARGYAQLAEASWTQGRVLRAERYATRALELADRCDDANARTRAHLARAQTRWLQLDLQGAHEALLAALESGSNSGDPWLARIPKSRLALTLFWLGRLEEARSFALSAQAQNEQAANFSEQSLALAALTCVAVACGEYEDAERHAEAALFAIRLSRYTWSASLVFPALISARLLQDDVLGARSALDQWTETVSSLDGTTYGDTIQLVDLLIDRHADASDGGQRVSSARPGWASGEQAIYLGGVQRLGALVELADAAPSTEMLPQWRGALERAMDTGMLMTDGLVMLLPRVHADLCAREALTDEAAAGYEAAIAKAEAMGCWPELARAQLGYAQLIREHEPEGARARAARAADLFSSLSMPLYEREARELLAPAEPPPTPGDAAVPVAPFSTSRDTVVLLFTDVVDSTRLTEELGDEAYLARAEALDERIRASIDECHGEPEDGVRPGDGVLAFFTRAEDAVRCAALAHAHAAATGLQLHVGIHIGEVIRSRTGIHGGAVNLAARVCAMAPPGYTITSAALRSAASTLKSATFEEFGVFDLKGIAEPQLLFVARMEVSTTY